MVRVWCIRLSDHDDGTGVPSRVQRDSAEVVLVRNVRRHILGTPARWGVLRLAWRQDRTTANTHDHTTGDGRGNIRDGPLTRLRGVGDLGRGVSRASQTRT